MLCQYDADFCFSFQIFPIRPSEVIISLYRIGCCDPANDVTVPYVHLIGCQSLLWLRAEGEQCCDWTWNSHRHLTQVSVC